MNRQAGPSFQKVAPPVVRCEQCDGRGVTQGVFHELDCPECDAFGYLHAVTGEVLAHADQILVLRDRIRRWRNEANALKKCLAQSDYTPQYPDNRRMRD